MTMDEWQALTGFDPAYTAAMLRVERATCEHCGVSLGAHAARFVREACDRTPAVGPPVGR